MKTEQGNRADRLKKWEGGGRELVRGRGTEREREKMSDVER